MNTLSLDTLNKLSPYRVVKSSDNDYWFVTVNGIYYNISFNEEFEIGGCMAFQFGIFNHEHKHAPFDPNIKRTIIAIINEFFAKNLNVLLYTCDSSDKREKARNRLFIKWFKEENGEEKFIIKTAETIIDGQGMYLAIIVENTNPRLKEIVEEFEVTSTMLTSGEK